MFDEMLKEAGKAAGEARRVYGVDSHEYKAAIDKIDEINHYWKQSAPRMFIAPDDPDLLERLAALDARNALAKAQKIQ